MARTGAASRPISLLLLFLVASLVVGFFSRTAHARPLHRDSIRPASTAGAAGRHALDEITIHARMRRERRSRSVRLFSAGESASLSPPPSLQPASELFDVCSFPGPISLNITPSFIGTTWKGWGTSLAWQGNYIGGFPKDRMDTLLDLVFHRNKGLGLNIVRYNIGGGHNPEKSPQFSKDLASGLKAMPGYWPAEAGPYDWSADQRQRNVLFGARERGANVFEAFSNSPPWWMTVSGDVAGASVQNQPNLQPQYEGKFVDYLTTVVEKFAKDPAWNLTFDTLEPFNEPLENFWNAGNGQEGCNLDVPAISRLLRATGDSLKQKGLQTKVAAFDSWTENTVPAVKSITGMDQVKRINVHGYMDPAPSSQNPVSYTSQIYSKMSDIAKGMGKEVWVSESGPMGRYGQPFDLSLYMARNVIETVNILQASAYVYWLAYDPDSRWTLIHFPWNYPAGYTGTVIKPKRSKRWYIFKMLTSLAKPGSQPLTIPAECSHGIAGFFNEADSVVSLFIVNQKAEAKQLSVNLEGFRVNSRGITKAVVRRTSWVHNMAQSEVIRGGKASITIEGQSFVSVHFTNVRRI
ncbi:hypothetical protein CLOM_g13663 [Closterium sp. NIES-68]|nr:hypothetical protein CLOM_g13663 [Closterium sp. NIES-68]GJP85916.1 hypothetical protein CLOP_g16008 [Closterium sp. NIES-67]